MRERENPSDLEPESSRKRTLDPRKKLIGELLVDEGIITQAQLDDALREQKVKGGKVVENLIALEHLNTRVFLRFLSRQPGMASIDLLNYTIPADVLSLIPVNFALKHEILPIDKMGRDLTVGMACPLDSRTIEELQTMTGLRVRPLLVSMHDVRVALKRYYGEPEKKTVPTANYRLSAKEEASLRPVNTPSSMPEELLQQVESSLTFESLAHLVRDVKGLPALPETVTQVRAAMDNPKSSAKEVAEILERDPSLSAKALSLANSSAVGASQRVNTVQMAVSLLGLREVYSMALAAAVVNYFERSKFFDYKAYWKRSMFCAKAARIIARKSGQVEPSVAFGAGLMHDLGRLVLAEIAPSRYTDVDQKMKDAEIIAKEHDLFGISHPEVGFILAETWKLPEEVAQPVRWHGELAAADVHKQVVAAVTLSSLMADAYGKITKDNVAALARECRAAMDILKMDDQQFIQVLGETAQAMKEV